MKATRQVTKCPKLDCDTLASFTLPAWTTDDYVSLLDLLTDLSDPGYAEFTTKGTRSRYPILGVRLPLLRQLTQVRRSSAGAVLARR